MSGVRTGGRRLIQQASSLLLAEDKALPKFLKIDLGGSTKAVAVLLSTPEEKVLGQHILYQLNTDLDSSFAYPSDLVVDAKTVETGESVIHGYGILKHIAEGGADMSISRKILGKDVAGYIILAISEMAQAMSKEENAVMLEQTREELREWFRANTGMSIVDGENTPNEFLLMSLTKLSVGENIAEGLRVHRMRAEVTIEHVVNTYCEGYAKAVSGTWDAYSDSQVRRTLMPTTLVSLMKDNGYKLESTRTKQ